MPTLLFNFLLLCVDAAGLSWVRQRPGPLRLFIVLLAASAASLPLAIGVWLLSGWPTPFGIARFGAWALFGHGFLLLVGGAVLLRRRRPWAVACVIAVLALEAVAYYAFLIEPTALELTRYEIRTSKLTRSVRVGVLADLQTDRVGEYEREALVRLMREEPDLLLLTGDYVQGLQPDEYDALEVDLNALLHSVGLRAPLGVYAVRGNVDRQGWPRIFDGLPVRSFEHTESVALPELRVTGLSFHESFDDWPEVPPSETFHIVFGHGPNFALGGIRADLLVAGHTHGGQVRLPFLGPPVILSGIPRSWAAGRTELDHGPTLIVSKGVGMERERAPRLRFLCRPELVLIDLLPALARTVESF